MERRRSERELKVLVVDDEDDLRELLDMSLARMGLHTALAGSIEQARGFLATERFALCLTDMRLPDGEGMELVRHIAEHHRDVPVAVITAYGSMDNAVAALKSGAFDYIAKPVSIEQLRALVRSALDLPSRAGEARASDTDALVGDAPALALVRDMIAKLARSGAPVHIGGESGSGKERAARLIHELGARRAGPFVAVNCGAIPETLVESEFFGYAKGAFTGADSDREGYFQAAAGGTLFLDEVGDLPLSMQVKLLRTIQEKSVRRIGARTEEHTDIRLISATHRNLRQMVDDGRFRQDLFYRLNVLELRMPSLRECRESIPQLAQTLLERIAAADGAHPVLSRGAISALCAYPFPGNVRELENVLERAYALSADGEIGEADLGLQPMADDTPMLPDGELPLQDYLDRMERAAIEEALRKTRYNRTAAARLLGVTFRSLRYRLQRLGLND
ncbi:MAG: sigma-54 dependent transcriptional regulator [Gammaproteobacteria bacterium]|jgi:two-component system, NtrC family, response regulator PilR|nr:sigma-54 dependent transcriptional regulator [Gammaproteobacteria bacterium]MBU0773037.1 sigma-54 dependent transcriptional regulator [Gammaproteobacteria bacterium]MBU0854847.1 sigma-54 dependent transcriptional regulator [Gammaproteobacteria bacterium]MBU1845245.1 sigma-54 dependent transcriptional regulator [Gammaproteobacteria bacterium]